MRGEGYERRKVVFMSVSSSFLAAGGTSLDAPSVEYPWPSAAVDASRLLSYLQRCIGLGIGYGLGAKAGLLTAIPPDYEQIDCSGWVRAAVAVATYGKTILPDGSVVQHEWCDRVGLKRSNQAALLLPDNYVRICFIAPSSLHPVGHVFLCRNAKTLESYGGNGPGSRSVLVHISAGILQRLTTAVYVLGRPE